MKKATGQAGNAKKIFTQQLSIPKSGSGNGVARKGAN